MKIKQLNYQVWEAEKIKNKEKWRSLRDINTKDDQNMYYENYKRKKEKNEQKGQKMTGKFSKMLE